MADERIEIEIVLDDGSIAKGFQKVQSQGKKTSNRLEKAFSGIGDKIKRNLLGIGAAIAALFTIGAAKKLVNNFIDFEKAVVGVGKTTNATASELANLTAQIQDMAQNIPVATNDLLELAKVAGQFGIRGSANILKFVDTMARLQSATDLVGEDGARSIARILAVTKQGVKVIDKFGSVLVALGNNFETTESRILETTNEIIRGIGVYGVSAQEAAALGATMDALGGKFQASGSAVATTFERIDKAIGLGGKRLIEFARIIGTTTDQLKKDFREDAFETFRQFVFGLKRVQVQTKSVTKELDRLGLSDKRVRKGLLPLIDNLDKLTFALKIQEEEFRTGRAIREESARAFNTLGSDVIRLGNAFTTLGNTITATSTGPLRTFTKNITLLGEATTRFFRKSESGTTGELARLSSAFEDLNEKSLSLQNQLIKSFTPVGKILGKILNQLDPEELTKKIDAVNKKMVKNIQLQQELKFKLAKEGEVLREAELLKRLGIPSISGLQAELDGILGALGEFRNQDLFELQENLRQKNEVLKNSLDLELIDRTEFEEAKFRLAEAFNEKAKILAEDNKRLADLNAKFDKAVVNGISTSIQTVIRAVEAGRNAFEALGKNIVGLAGDLAISVGQVVLATSIGKLALLKDDPKLGIAAGLGLIALGTVLKLIAGSGFAAGTDAAATGGAVSGGDSGLIAQEDAEFDRGTAITVNVDGVITDPIATGELIAEILNETFNAGSSTIQVVNS